MNNDYRLKRGDIVVSFRGHDRNKLLVVTESFDDSVIVADGKTRPVEKAKQKNAKHVRFVAYSEEMAECIEQGCLTDDRIRKALSAVQRDNIKGFH